MRFGILRVCFNRVSALNFRFVDTFLKDQCVAVILHDQIVTVCDRDRMFVKSFIIFPKRNLSKTDDRKYQERKKHYYFQCQFAVLKQISNPANNHNEQSEKRKIRISICVRLDANLNQTNDRYQCAEKPQPAHQKILSILRLPNAEHGHNKQKCRRPNNLHCWNRFYIRIPDT